MNNNVNQPDLFEALEFENPTINVDAHQALKTPRLLITTRNQMKFRVGSIPMI